MTRKRVRLVGDRNIAVGTVLLAGVRVIPEDQLTIEEVFTKEVRVNPVELSAYREQLSGEDDIELVE